MTWDAVLRLVPTGVGVVGLVVLAGGYAWVWTAARRRTGKAAWGAATLYVLIGLLPFAAATLTGLVDVRRDSLQAGVWQTGLLVAIAPMGVALGRPITLLADALGDGGRARLHAVLRSAPLRLLAFPLVTPVLDTAIVLALFLTGWYQATVDSPVLRDLTCLVLFVSGLLFVLPLVGEGEDLMPGWATPGVRTALAIIDGLIDAIAGIVVMTDGHPLWTPASPTSRADLMADQSLSGAILLALFEAVGVPLMLASVITWMRADEAEARAYDAQVGARDAEIAARAAAGRGDRREADGSSVPAAQPDRPDDAAVDDAPWWLNDPRFADRYRRPGR